MPSVSTIKKNNSKIEKSIFAGVPRDSLNFSEIIDIFNGKRERC